MVNRSLRVRGYQVEATYARDVEARKTAEDFYDALIKFLKTRSDELIPRTRDGGYSVLADKFWDHPIASRFGVVFTPVGSGPTKGTLGGFGKAGGVNVLIFPAMLGPGDKRYLDTRLIKDVVVHEMIHYLDPGRVKVKTKGVSRYGTMSGGLDASKYYNDPGEWNAFWQEGAAQAERMIRSKSRLPVDGQERMVQVFFGDGSLKEFRKRVDKFWSEDFLANMNPVTARKFDKRLAALWQEFKGQGLL